MKSAGGELRGGGADQGSELQRTTAAYRSYYVEQTRTLGQLLNGAGWPDGGRGQTYALRFFVVERENLQSALEFALDLPDVAGLQTLLPPLAEYNLGSGVYNETLAFCRRAAELAARLQERHLEVLARWYASEALFRLGQLHEAAAAIEPASGLCCDNTLLHSMVNFQLAALHWRRGTYELAPELIEQARQVFEEAGETSWTARCVNLMGVVKGQYDIEAARTLYLEARDIYESQGDERRVLAMDNNLGVLSLMTGDYEGTVELVGRFLAGDVDPDSQALGRLNTSVALYMLGRRSEAAAMLAEAMRLFFSMGDEVGMMNCLGCAGALLSVPQPVSVTRGELSTGPELHSGFLALVGSQQQGAARGFANETFGRQLVASCRQRIETALADGVLPATLRDVPKQASRMSLRELALVTIEALERC